MLFYNSIDQGAGMVTEYSLSNNGNSPAIMQTIILDDPSPNDWFGTSMALFDQTLVISATGPGLNGDAIYIYVTTADTSTWTLQQVISIEDSAQLGYTLSLSNENLVIGSMQTQSAFVFNHSNIRGNATQTPTFAPVASPSAHPSAIPSAAPSRVPTGTPTIAVGIAFSAVQAINGVNYTAFEATLSASLLSLQQTIAGSINSTGISSSNVLINSVLPSTATTRRLQAVSLSSQQSSGIVTTYTVSTPNAPGFTSSNTAFIVYTTNLNAAVTLGTFNKLLMTTAAVNGATSLNNPTALQPQVQPLLPTMSPTPVPTSNGGKTQLGTDAIAGIVIGSIAFVVIMLAAFYVIAAKLQFWGNNIRPSDPPNVMNAEFSTNTIDPVIARSPIHTSSPARIADIGTVL